VFYFLLALLLEYFFISVLNIDGKIQHLDVQYVKWFVSSYANKNQKGKISAVMPMPRPFWGHGQQMRCLAAKFRFHFALACKKWIALCLKNGNCRMNQQTLFNTI